MSVGLRWRLRWRLSVLWALQWAITGAILTYLPLYFAENGISQEQLGQLLAVSALGLWVAPFIVGQVCDRWLASEKYLAVAHFIGGVTLICIPIATEVYQETGANFAALVGLVGLYAIAYFPTIPLASSLTFRQLPDPDAQFGKVRIWGTVGWVLAGLLLSLWLGQTQAYRWLMVNFPAWKGTLTNLQATLSWVASPSSADCFRLAAILSFALSSFCVFLPATPPTRAEKGSVAPLQTLAMFRNRTFSLLIATSFLLAAVIPFYLFAVPKMLTQLPMEFDSKWVPALMTIGQISEFPALLLLPYCLKRFGLKMTFALGMGAWLLRYALFSLGQPAWLILTGIGLHGVCHVFLIIVIQLYVDAQCRSDLRASAQNLFAFITMGIAMPAGFLLSGKLGDWCTNPDTGITNYHTFFSVPAVVVLVLLLAYWKWFQFSAQPEHPGELDLSQSPSEPLSSDAPRLGGSK